MYQVVGIPAAGMGHGFTRMDTDENGAETAAECEGSRQNHGNGTTEAQGISLIRVNPWLN